MHTEQRRQAQELLRSRGITRALFAEVHTITWLTGYAPPIQLGENLFAGGPPLLWYDDGHFVLLVLDALAPAAGDLAADADCDVETYAGYTVEQPIESAKLLAEALGRVIGRSPLQGGSAGVETTRLPMSLIPVLARAGMGDWTEIDGWFAQARMVKTDEELAKLRANFALVETGHAAARRSVAAGQREIDVWTDIHAAIERMAGRRVPLGNDCTVGTREGNIGGWPGTEALGPQGSIIIDLSTVLYGYWSDSCATYVAGEPTSEQVAIHRVVSDALQFAIGLLQPGAMAKQVDEQVRDFIAAAGYPVYPHHTGHGVGVSGHEEPRIVPNNEQVLEPGMVIMLEPGIYLPGKTGVRLEDAVLVTENGPEVLTHHDKSLG
jgi:Xaa-Pro aminopeptidase